MPTEKPRIIFIAEDDLIKRLDDFQFGERIRNRSEAIRILLEKALNDWEDKNIPE